MLLRLLFSCIAPAVILKYGPLNPWTLVLFAVSLALPLWVLLSSGVFGRVVPVEIVQESYEDDDLNDPNSPINRPYLGIDDSFTQGDGLNKIHY